MTVIEGSTVPPPRRHSGESRNPSWSQAQSSLFLPPPCGEGGGSRVGVAAGTARLAPPPAPFGATLPTRGRENDHPRNNLSPPLNGIVFSSHPVTRTVCATNVG